VRHSQADLETSKASLDDVLARGGSAPKGVYGWYVDLQSNSVVVSIGKGQERAAINFVAASRSQRVKPFTRCLNKGLPLVARLDSRNRH